VKLGRRSQRQSACRRARRRDAGATQAARAPPYRTPRPALARRTVRCGPPVRRTASLSHSPGATCRARHGQAAPTVPACHKRAPPLGPLHPWTLSSHFPGQARRRGRRNSTGCAAPIARGPHCRAPETSGVFCAIRGQICEPFNLFEGLGAN
jgi:hypothetical protein